MPVVPGLSVGHPTIDSQHGGIFSRMDELRRRVETGDAPAAALALSALWDEVVVHFATEDAMMEGHLYPERAAHRASHHLFLRDLDGLKAQLGAAGLSDEIAVWARRIREWFAFHVQTNDAPLVRHLARQHAARIVAAARGEPAAVRPKPSDA